MIDVEILKKHIYDVLGAIYEVHNELGPGLNEYCYQEGLNVELSERSIPFIKEMSFHPMYHGRELNAEFRLDFICKGDIIIECKSVTELIRNHRAQLFNHMRLLGKPCGILVNFYPHTIEPERYFFDKNSNNIIGVDGRIIYNYKRR